MNFRRLELLFTEYFLLSVLGAIGLVLVGGGLLVLVTDLGIEAVAAVVDSAFKTVALLAATCWALNRYFVFREDAPQLRVDHDVDLVPAPAFSASPGWALLLCRLDIVNTGRSLIPPLEQFFTVDAVEPRPDGSLKLVPLHRWPDEGTHLTGRIEPGSWSALNFELPVPASVRAVRIHVHCELPDGEGWTWHKSFNLARAALPPRCSEGSAVSRGEPCG